MDSEIKTPAGGRILFDGSRVATPGPELFDAGHWPGRQVLQGGRGQVYFVDCAEQAWVIKPYLRGGFVRRFIERSYLFLGYEKTRMFREYRLLRYLTSRNVPVPHPVAAWVSRSGLRYEGAIIIERFEGVHALSEILLERQLAASEWRAVGCCIGRLHDEHINHKDLNASNILVNEASVFIIDFDRCALQRLGARFYRRANLRRLRRSLMRVAGAGGKFSAEDWDAFMRGYASNGKDLHR